MAVPPSAVWFLIGLAISMEPLRLAVLRIAPPTLQSCGVVFELSPAGNQWTEQVLDRFTGHGGCDVTTGGNYAYPKTAMSWFFCTTPPVNNSTGQGKFLIDQVLPKNTPDVNC